jgi:hypothetical protein
LRKQVELWAAASAKPDQFASWFPHFKIFLAIDTVKGHNRRIFEMLCAARRPEAIARARQLGLI